MPQLKEKVPPSPIKVPPHNRDAEQAILAGILINNDAMNQIVDVLSADDFYREAHAHLFEGMVGLYNNNEPIDLITLSQHLTKKNILDKAGGTDYLASLLDAVSTSAGILYHARIVRDHSVRRKLISQCSVISESCFEHWQETDELLDMAEQSIFDIAEDKSFLMVWTLGQQPAIWVEHCSTTPEMQTVLKTNSIGMSDEGCEQACICLVDLLHPFC